MTEYSLGLSGGERSFSTICFILSLWQVMECPFYMLDEFDVFMDAFNRKVSQQALMVHAKAHPDRQFFLFSPLDLVELPSKEEASVIRYEHKNMSIWNCTRRDLILLFFSEDYDLHVLIPILMNLLKTLIQVAQDHHMEEDATSARAVPIDFFVHHRPTKVLIEFHHHISYVF